MTDTNGDLPVAGKSTLTHRREAPTAMVEIPPSDRDVAKDFLRPALASWCRHVVSGVEKGERTAMNLWGKAMGVVGADVEVNIGLLLTRELGVATMEEAKRKMALVASVEGIEYEGAISVMEAEVRAFWAARGKRVLIVDDSAEVATP